MTGPIWRRSRFCNGASACVEVAVLPDGGVVVRDSKDPDGGRLSFTAGEWAAFTAGVRENEFDPLVTQAMAALGPGVDSSGRASGVVVAREDASRVSR